MFGYRLHSGLLRAASWGLVVVVFTPGVLVADVVRDGTVGPDASVQPIGPDFEIPEDFGELRGANLFHSFQQFSLTQTQSATFSGSGSVENIIGRVTGGGLSTIDGLLRSTVPGAALYLMNPSGIVFGPNAQLDVQGAFHASTADTLEFDSGELFSAVIDGGGPILSVASPEAFGFLSGAAESIELNGSVLNSEYGITLSGQNVELTDGAMISTAGSDGQNGGDIVLSAAATVSLSGLDGDGFGSTLQAITSAAGDAGDISVSAPVIALNDGAYVTTTSFAGGDGGVITLAAGERLTLSGADAGGMVSRLEADAFGDGHAGVIDIEANVVELSDGAYMTSSTFGEAAGGDVSIRAGEQVVMSGVNPAVNIGATLQVATFGVGNAGRLLVDAPIIELRDGAFVSTSSMADGAGGAIVMTAEERLTLTGHDPRGRGSNLAAGTFADGQGGVIEVDAGLVELQDGAFMLSGTLFGGGTGGDLSVTASERLTLSGTDGARGFGSTLMATSYALGESGAIQVSAPVIELYDGASIASRSFGVGEAGSVHIAAQDSVHLFEGSAISTEAQTAPGGDIAIDVGQILYLQDSEITTDVSSGSAGGGNITVGASLAPELMVLDDSRLTAQADTGIGGNIDISARQVLASPESLIDASAGPAGIDGNVVIAAPERDLAGELVRSAPSFLDAGALLQPGCQAHGDDTPGRFNVAHQQGLPLSPEGLLLAFDAVLPSPPVGASMKVSTVNAAALPSGEYMRGVALKQQFDGHYSASLETLSNALVADSAPAQNSAATLGSAANAYLALGEAEIALGKFAQAIDSVAEDDDRLLATLQNNLGNVQMVRQDFAAALEAYHLSAQHARRAADVTQRAKALSNGARAALADGELDRAGELLKQARGAAQAFAASQDRAYVLIHLAKTAQLLSQADRDENQHFLAMAYRDLRNAVMLTEDLADDRTLSYALGNLGGLYQRQNRLEEALYLTRLAQHAAERANAPESHYRWHWQAGNVLWAQGQYPGALDAYRRAVTILEGSRPETLAQYAAAHVRFRQVVAPVYLDLVDALLQHSGRVDDATGLLLEARATIEQLKAAELRDFFRDECITELEAKNAELDNVSPTAAVVYPIMLPQRLELLVSLPGGLQRHPVAVDAAALTQAIHEFRTLVETQGQEQRLRDVAQRLYNWLVRPYDKALDKAGIDTLVFVPDGPLRTAPLAALHDGDGYLVRRYGIVVTAGLSLTDPRPLDREHPRLLLAGLSDAVQDYPPLPYVPQELDYIHQLFGGRLLLNQDFTLPKVEQALDAPVTIVHLASHAQFSGSANNSYLLTHDGRLSMAQLGEVLEVARFRERPLELLVLSACQTAVGDDRAAMGLAGIGLKAGARSALGSLWFISDAGTTELMSSFYGKLRDPSLSKAQALQQAQQALLADGRFSHPFYWSPFLLMNNWL